MTTLYAASGVAGRTNLYAERVMLTHAQPVLILEKTGKPYMMPRNKTDTVRFRRPNTYAAATMPLTEGVSPSPGTHTYTDVSVTLEQYGQVMEISDKVGDLHEDPVMMDIVKQLGENIGRTREALNWLVLRAGTNVFYANGSARTDVNTPISLQKQRKVTRDLKDQKAKYIREVIGAGAKYATEPIERAYIAMAHTHTESDIRNMSGFTPCSKYAQMDKICEEEIGSVEDVRYVVSPDLDPILAGGSSTLNGMVSAGASAVDIYPVLVFGRESWAYVALKGMGSVSPTVIPAGKVEKTDPLGQRGVAGWKTWHAAVILNQDWMARLEVGVTDL